ncbi:MAG: hypothetical protein AAGI44_01400 [Pseudomonadota bacterium]
MADTWLDSVVDANTSVGGSTVPGAVRGAINFNGTDNYAQGGYISPNDKKFASKTQAYIARDAWEDYQRTYQPYEADLISDITGSELLDQRLAAITVNNDRAFDVATMDAEMRRGRYGVQQTGQAAAIDDRQMATARVTSEIDAANKTRTHIDDRNLNILAGADSGARTAIEGT